MLNLVQRKLDLLSRLMGPASRRCSAAPIRQLPTTTGPRLSTTAAASTTAARSRRVQTTHSAIYSAERNAWETHPPQREAEFWEQLTAAHRLIVQGKPLRHSVDSVDDSISACNCNYVLKEDALSWVDAEAACTAMGGHLASAHSPEDWASIEYLIANTAWCAVPDTHSVC